MRISVYTAHSAVLVAYRAEQCASEGSTHAHILADVVADSGSWHDYCAAAVGMTIVLQLFHQSCPDGTSHTAVNHWNTGLERQTPMTKCCQKLHGTLSFQYCNHLTD